ncbi:ROK family transcriptional regulator [Tessaracoccus antarcticus]|nr:ROK family transcriptional regulator [Tessaracoccus antarcticus]
MVGDYNQSLVLDKVRRAPAGLSQVEIIQLTGLSKQTVSNITRRLSDDGWFRSLAATVTGRGKPRTPVQINPGRLFAIGLHLDPSLVTAVILDLGGATVASRSVVGLLNEHPSESINRIVDLVEEMIHRSGVERTMIAGVGVASPGPLDIPRGSLINPPKLDGWDGFNITAALRDSFSYPVILDKDTLAAAIGECWARDNADGESLLFMYLGTGIGCAFASNGTIVRGATHNAGEIGHIRSDTQGTLCFCGRRGCLGRATDPYQLIEDAVVLGLVPSSSAALSYDGALRVLEELGEMADEGIPGAVNLLTRAANAIAEATRVLVSALDASLVVFGGPFWSPLSKHYLSVIEAQLEAAPQHAPPSPRIETTVMGNAAGAIGAASLVFDQELSTRLSTYQISI